MIETKKLSERLKDFGGKALKCGKVTFAGLALTGALFSGAATPAEAKAQDNSSQYKTVDGKDANSVLKNTIAAGIQNSTKQQKQDPISIAMRNMKFEEISNFIIENNMIVAPEDREKFPKDKLAELTILLEKNGIEVPKQDIPVQALMNHNATSK